jgi:hypothetical protein
MRIVIIAIVMVFWLAAPVWADSGFKEGAKEVGQRVQHLGKDIKEGSKEGAENFKKDVKKAGREGTENFKKDAKQAGL